MPRWLDDLDRRATRFLAMYAFTVLRVGLGVVFVWFGALKLMDRSPVAGFVHEVLWWAPGDWVVEALGALEVAAGIGLLFALALRVVLLLFWAQSAAVLLMLAVHPDRAFFERNPVLLTTSGEFAVRSLVLLAAGLVVGSTMRRRG